MPGDTGPTPPDTARKKGRVTMLPPNPSELEVRLALAGLYLNSRFKEPGDRELLRQHALLGE